MDREILVPDNEAQWLEWRKADLTSTEIAALFGASPYTTVYELYHRKAGALPAEAFEVNERMKWGNRLEAAIAAGIAEDEIIACAVEPEGIGRRRVIGERVTRVLLETVDLAAVDEAEFELATVVFQQQAVRS